LIKKQYFLLLTLLAGAALRIAVYIQNRSLFLDEANLARNIAERTGRELFLPLDYEQFAPPLFTWLAKVSTLVFGNTEWGLRLVPLLAGLASLYLFYRIALALIPAFPAQWLAVWVFAFNGQLLHYATECKQYSTDVFAALLFIYMALLQGKKDRFGWKQALAWALGGAVMIWFSMPLVFILCGVGIYLLVHYRKNKTAFRGIGIAVLAWLFSFCLFFLLLLKPDADSGYLQQAHGEYFLPLIPSSGEEWEQLGRLLLSLVKDFSGKTTVAQIVGVIGLLGFWGIGFLGNWGSGELGKWVVLLALPVFTCLLASGMHYYSLMSRLVLFLVPVLLLTSAAGWGYFWERSNRWLKVVIALALVAMGSVHESYRFFVKPFEISEIRPALEFVEKAQQPGDRLFLYKWSAPPFDFYTRLHERPLKFYDQKPFSDIQPVEGDRVWLIYNHLLSKETNGEMEADLARFRETGTVQEAFRSQGAAVWLWSVKGQ